MYAKLRGKLWDYLKIIHIKKEEKNINMRYFDCTRTFKLSFFNYLVATDYNVCQIQVLWDHYSEKKITSVILKTF